MKRFKKTLLALTLTLALGAALLPVGVRAAAQPRLYLRSIPAFGATSDVYGSVVDDSGTPVDASAYCVTLFLQLTGGQQHWVKPTFETPKVFLEDDGGFRLDCTTGDNDEKAQLLHILLIPADYMPVRFSDTLAHALDYVKVERAQGQDNTVTPASALEPPPEPPDQDAAKELAVAALADALSAARETLYVYRDFSDTENHFTQKAKLFGTDETLVADMDENCRTQPYAGDSCIRCELETRRGDWGGWLFLNGYLPQGEIAPRLNDGQQAGQGLDLSGATALRFCARGEQGGERVEFFTAGFGYNGETGAKRVPYPDSAGKQSLGFVTLTDQWQECVIDLKDADLSSISGGFGFVCSGDKSGAGRQVFYLDEIRFTGATKALADAPVLLRSYDTDNIYIKNAAFSYDNALAALAFIAEGMQDEAAQLLGAFVYAVENDRYAPGRVRNAYAAGDISAPSGWDRGARLPGWYDAADAAWYEDRYQVGCNVGNTAYVALALLQYDAVFGGESYQDTAAALMDWVLENCRDDSAGFIAGYDGWPEGDGDALFPLTYKSIEHNIDAYAAFRRLYDLTGEESYRRGAQSALRFIYQMYDREAGVFYTGTQADGVTVSRDNIVLDAQVWAALALGEGFTPYEAALERLAAMRTPEGGYPFCESNENGGWWAEGTAYTALLYRLRGEEAAADAALDALCRIQREDGLFPAATVSALSTGIDLFDGSPWVYSTDGHIAPTAWFIMALDDFDPYAFDDGGL